MNRALKSIFKAAFKYCATRHCVAREEKYLKLICSSLVLYLLSTIFYENFLKSHTCQSNLLGRYTNILYQKSQLPHHFRLHRSSHDAPMDSCAVGFPTITTTSLVHSRGAEGTTNSLFPRGNLIPLQMFMQLFVPKAVKI